MCKSPSVKDCNACLPSGRDTGPRLTPAQYEWKAWCAFGANAPKNTPLKPHPVIALHQPAGRLVKRLSGHFGNEATS